MGALDVVLVLEVVVALGACAASAAAAAANPSQCGLRCSSLELGWLEREALRSVGVSAARVSENGLGRAREELAAAGARSSSAWIVRRRTVALRNERSSASVMEPPRPNDCALSVADEARASRTVDERLMVVAELDDDDLLPGVRRGCSSPASSHESRSHDDDRRLGFLELGEAAVAASIAFESAEGMNSDAERWRSSLRSASSSSSLRGAVPPAPSVCDNEAEDEAALLSAMLSCIARAMSSSSSSSSSITCALWLPRAAAVRVGRPPARRGRGISESLSEQPCSMLISTGRGPSSSSSRSIGKVARGWLMLVDVD